MEDSVIPPKGFVAGNDRLDRMLAKYPRTEGTQRYIDSGEYEGEYPAEGTEQDPTR